MPGSEATDVGGGAEPTLSQEALFVLGLTQAVFFVALAWCVLLMHDHDAQNAGISYYGVHHQTIALAIVGYVAAAMGLWRLSTIFYEAGLGLLAWVGLRVVAVSLIVLLLTPYTGGAFLNWSHMSTGVICALAQLAVAFALVRRAGSMGANLAFVVMLLGGIFGALSLPDWRFDILLYAEILIEVGFSCCLFGWTREISAAVPAPRGGFARRA
jgi:hypothetical protein